jgi:hypothetical protein
MKQKGTEAEESAKKKKKEDDLRERRKKKALLRWEKLKVACSPRGLSRVRNYKHKQWHFMSALYLLINAFDRRSSATPFQC